MKHNPNFSGNLFPSGGWTFVEMLIAVALSSVCLGAGALALQSISANSKRSTSLVEIDIGATNNQNFYGMNDGKISTYFAPNFGNLVYAQSMRDLLSNDTQRSTAIFCLPRSLPNTVRPETITFPGTPPERPNLDSPASFLKFLISYDATAETIYGSTAYRNVPPQSQPNTTIYLLGNSVQSDKIQVIAVYEIDFLTPSNRAGVYTSVRRYVGPTLTRYYDVFFKPGDGDAFYPQFVAFEQSSRRAANESNDLQRFQIAPGNPFYIIWLPDPSINPYIKPPITSVDSSSNPRSTYAKMSGKTAFSLVLPMFPSL